MHTHFDQKVSKWETIKLLASATVLVVVFVLGILEMIGIAEHLYADVANVIYELRN